MPLSIVQGIMASLRISKVVVLGLLVWTLYKCGMDIFRITRLVNFELVNEIMR